MSRLRGYPVCRGGGGLKRPALNRAVKTPATLRLGLDMVEWFKGHALEGGYQTEINQVLRRYVAGAGRFTVTG